LIVIVTNKKSKLAKIHKLTVWLNPTQSNPVYTKAPFTQYTIQPVVKPVWQPVGQQVVSCIQTSNRLSYRLYNRLFNSTTG